MKHVKMEIYTIFMQFSEFSHTSNNNVWQGYHFFSYHKILRLFQISFIIVPEMKIFRLTTPNLSQKTGKKVTKIYKKVIEQ